MHEARAHPGTGNARAEKQPHWAAAIFEAVSVGGDN